VAPKSSRASQTRVAYVMRLGAPSSARDRERVEALSGAGRGIRIPRNIVR